ncbi:hypothetical protein CEXT_302181 [Caerostris extrusa]|uniref:Uncharacterized protein n=1 Tax=Caerostris extrusa TaxID=172846 RepID=A0AAV4M5Y7_CAEEX|nr:hypothetical protein CEXT_302181 [Caerostris extrusa]
MKTRTRKTLILNEATSRNMSLQPHKKVKQVLRSNDIAFIYASWVHTLNMSFHSTPRSLTMQQSSVLRENSLGALSCLVIGHPQVFNYLSGNVGG